MNGISETPVDRIVMRVGDKVGFSGEKQSYTIRAMSSRFAICTRPFNPQRTVIYTIVDTEKMVRGPNNLVFNVYDYATDEGCMESLRDLESGEIEVSRRRSVPLVFSE